MFFLIAISSSACTQSRVSPGADIRIGGEVKREKGAPAAGARVFLSREGDIGEAFLLFPFLGLPCLADNPPPICDKGHLTDASDDGSYEFSVKGSYTQGFAGQAATLVLQTRLRRADDQIEGPGVTARFQVQTENLVMPMTFWKPQVAAQSEGFTGSVSWSEFPAGVVPADIPLTGARATVRFHQQGQLVWAFSGIQSGMTFDARLLEDSKGDFSVSTLIDGVDVPSERGTKLSMIFRSARLPYRGTSGAPVSRGKGCSVYNSAGEAVSVSPCRLTDGDFSEQLNPAVESPCPESQQCPTSVAKSTFVDLGETKEISLVVLRGCDSVCRLRHRQTAPAGSSLRLLKEGRVRLPTALWSHRLARQPRA